MSSRLIPGRQPKVVTTTDKLNTYIVPNKQKENRINPHTGEEYVPRIRVTIAGAHLDLLLKLQEKEELSLTKLLSNLIAKEMLTGQELLDYTFKSNGDIPAAIKPEYILSK